MTRTTIFRLSCATSLVAVAMWTPSGRADVQTASRTDDGAWSSPLWTYDPGFPPPQEPPDFPDNNGTTQFHAGLGDFDVILDQGVGNTATILSLSIASGGSLAWDSGVGVGLNVVGGPIGNGGFMSLNAGDFLGIGGDVELSGQGAINLTAADSRVITFGAGPHRLRINQHTIRGRGQIGFSSPPPNITNDGGFIIANQAGQTLTVTVQTDLTQLNGGQLLAQNGGILRFNGTNVFNTFGDNIIEAQDGSSVEIAAGAQIVGGTVKSTGSGQIHVLDTNLNNRFEALDVFTGTKVNLDPNASLAFVGNINNNGHFNLAAGSNTTIRVEGPVTLGGAGSIVLNDDFANAIRFGNTTASLEVGGSQRIFGAGDIGGGFNGAPNTITNNGQIVADLSGQTMRIFGGPLINNQLLTAGNGGILTISNFGSVNNTNGTIRANDSSTVVLNGSDVTGGLLDSVGSGLVLARAATFRNLTNTADVVAEVGESLFLDGQISNNGSITLFTQADMVLVGDATLAGSGTVKMGSQTQIANGAGPLRTFTNQGNTIMGQGSFGNNTLSMVNNATVDANVSGQILFIDPAPAGSMTNTATLQASNGGILHLNAGTHLNNGSGKIVARDGSTVRIVNLANITQQSNAEIRAEANATVEVSGNSVIDGGKLVTNTNAGQVDFGSRVRVTGSEPEFKNLSNEGFLLVDQGNAIADNVTNNRLIRVDNQRFLTLKNSLNLQTSGVVEVAGLNTSGALATVLQISGAVQLSGGGSVELSGATPVGTRTALIQGQSGSGPVLTNLASIIGVGNISGLTLINQGRVAATLAGSGPGAATLTLNSLNTTNSAFLEAKDGAVLRISAGNVNNSGGVIRTENGGIVELINSPTIGGGILDTTGGGVIRNLGVASLTLPIQNQGLFETVNAATTHLAGNATLTNSGTMKLLSQGATTQLIGQGNVHLVGGGMIELTDNLSNRISPANPSLHDVFNHGNTISGAGTVVNLVNDPGGTVHANGVRALTLTNPASNRGVFHASGAGGITINGSDFENDEFVNDPPGRITVDAGSNLTVVSSVDLVNEGQLTVNGVVTSVDFFNEGQLSGSGTINGRLINNGVLDPAPDPSSSDPAGTTTINGTYQGDLNAKMLMEFKEVIQLTGGGVTSDRVVVTGAATLNGSMVISFAPGFTGLPGDESVVMTFASRSGDVSIVNDTPFAGLTFNKIYTPTSLAVGLDALFDGDANLDARVNLSDFNILAANFGLSGVNWLMGDFTGDGLCNLADFNLLAANFGLAASPSGPTPHDWSALAAVVPEPSIGLALVTFATTLLVRRKRICLPAD